MKKAIFLLLGLVGSAGSLSAGNIMPTSYDMPNGDTGEYSYWDTAYTGSGNSHADGSLLSGGLGFLTDGIIASQNWSFYGAQYPNGPYVGWWSGGVNGLDPTIQFHFAGTVDIASVTIYSDNSYGSGDVGTPGAAVVNGTSYSITQPPFTGFSTAITLPVSVVGNELDLTLDQGAYPWIFVSEVTFSGPSSSVPDGGLTLAMFGTALSALALIRRKF
jgi:hypothetical protein